MLGLSKILKGRDLAVQGGEVLFDNVSEFRDLDGPVVKQGLSLGDYVSKSQFLLQIDLRDNETHAALVSPAFPSFP